MEYRVLTVRRLRARYRKATANQKTRKRVCSVSMRHRYKHRYKHRHRYSYWQAYWGRRGEGYEGRRCKMGNGILLIREAEMEVFGRRHGPHAHDGETRGAGFTLSRLFHDANVCSVIVLSSDLLDLPIESGESGNLWPPPRPAGWHWATGRSRFRTEHTPLTLRRGRSMPDLASSMQ